tara:strand:- start:507 stop:806 length:300 start_codon:yes stop_codon:yes gene_type:complete
MATRKTSESGAYMSQYDTEVEKRLKALESHSHPTPTGKTAKAVNDKIAALEKKVAELEAKCNSGTSGGSSDGDGRLDLLISILKRTPTLNIEKLSKGNL